MEQAKNMGQIIDGKKIAAEVLADLKVRVEALEKKGIKPGLATVLVGDNPASEVYVRQKIKQCEAIGINSIHKPLPGNISQKELEIVIGELNRDKKVHGMIVQMPLPKQLDPEKAILAVDPKKDADGLHPLNQGLIARLKSWDEIIGSGVPIPCTPYGIIHLLLKEGVEISGKSAVVVGRSNLVGKPVAQLLLSLNATVTIAHSKTRDLFSVCHGADILIAALGVPHSIKKDAIKKGATVIDVGISRMENGLKGDVDFESAKSVASRITPVPGGVGPMTVAMLLSNTVSAAEKTAVIASEAKQSHKSD